ncbi:MAG: rhomboid family intramembrane serine protease, partial [Candidatus Acidiferrum sp.]
MLTASFVHGGLLHIVMNMSMLIFVGHLTEMLWGRWRYLIIYLSAALGGSWLALAGNAGGPELIVGASGALCGVIAALAVWLAFHWRYVPRGLALQLRTGLIASAVILVFISLFPRVSGLGHLGGALFGTAAAVLLYWQRWGSTPVRWLALAGLVGLPALAIGLLHHSRSADTRWQVAEQRIFLREISPRLFETPIKAARLRHDRVLPLLETPPARRDPTRVENALREIAQIQPELQSLAADLRQIGPFQRADIEKARKFTAEQANEMLDQFAEAAQALRNNSNTVQQNEAEENSFERQFLSRVPPIVN